jgi:Ion channel
MRWLTRTANEGYLFFRYMCVYRSFRVLMLDLTFFAAWCVWALWLQLHYATPLAKAFQPWRVAFVCAIPFVGFCWLHLYDMYRMLTQDPFDPRRDTVDFIVSAFDGAGVFIAPYLCHKVSTEEYPMAFGSVMTHTQAKLAVFRRQLVVRWALNLVQIVLSTSVVAAILSGGGGRINDLSISNGPLRAVYYTWTTLITLGCGDTAKATDIGQIFVLYCGLITISIVVFGASLAGTAWLSLPDRLRADIDRKLNPQLLR